ncbi:angiopoietin-2 [Aplysia californica]|uniref:Angiopoietin-2 n=1 Tax=Aplysia californica TaxID=6500 RepID=A0ABM0JND6_APLCA|nr:angiopoietin-2 [Aplysia californica]XP_012937602.1 angiopoietin-2 [Aplysia californica]
MALNMMSSYVLLAAAVLLSSQALVLNVTTDQVEVGKTRNVSLECLDNFPQPDNSEVVMIRVLKKDHAGWNSFAEIRDDDTEVRPKRKGVLAVANKTLTVNSFLRITWPVATDDTIGTFRCDVISLTSWEGVNWQKSLPTFVSRKSDVTLQILSSIVEENKNDYLQRLRSQRETILEHVTTTAEEGKRQCVQQKENLLQNVTATVESLRESFESKWKSQLQVLSHTVDQNKRECPHQMLSQKRQILENVETIMEQNKLASVQLEERILGNVTATFEQNRREFVQLEERIIGNVTAVVDQTKREFVQQTEDILRNVTATFDQNEMKFVQLEERILGNVTAMIEALEAGFERKLSATKTQLQPNTCADVTIQAPRPVVTLSNGMQVVCDTETDNGGWIVVQRRTSADVDFFRGWVDYKKGFGDLSGNFWFGLEKIHQLTNKERYELRVDFTYQGTNYYAIYKNFLLLGESENYKIKISGYSGGNAGNQMSYENGQAFTTKDRDNDPNNSGNCAIIRHGAWWYNECGRVNLNGAWATDKWAKGVCWYIVTGWGSSVTFSEMKIRPLAK